MSLVVDARTYMLNKEWLALLRQHGAPRYGVKPVDALPDVIHLDALGGELRHLVRGRNAAAILKLT